MLEEKTYTISEIAAIIGGSSDRQAKQKRNEFLQFPLLFSSILKIIV